MEMLGLTTSSVRVTQSQTAVQVTGCIQNRLACAILRMSAVRATNSLRTGYVSATLSKIAVHMIGSGIGTAIVNPICTLAVQETGVRGQDVSASQIMSAVQVMTLPGTHCALVTPKNTAVQVTGK